MIVVSNNQSHRNIIYIYIIYICKLHAIHPTYNFSWWTPMKFPPRQIHLRGPGFWRMTFRTETNDAWTSVWERLWFWTCIYMHTLRIVFWFGVVIILFVSFLPCEDHIATSICHGRSSVWQTLPLGDFVPPRRAHNWKECSQCNPQNSHNFVIHHAGLLIKQLFQHKLFQCLSVAGWMASFFPYMSWFWR